MSFYRELQRRNVFRAGTAYAVVGWLLIQAADTVLPRLGTPDWVVSAFMFLIILGFPIAVVLAWAFELTPEGIKPTQDVSEGESITPQTGRKLNTLIIGVLSLAVIFLVIDNYVLKDGNSTVPQSNAFEATDIPPVEITESATLEKSIVVLPFTNLSSDPEQEFFADGVSEEILNALSRINDLKVTGRTSSFYFKNRNEDLRTIGETLGVNYILEGSIRKSGDQVRVIAQLNKASDGFQLWSDTFDQPFEDIFVIQDNIASRVAQAMEVTLGVGSMSDPNMTRNVEAFEQFLLGVGNLNQVRPDTTRNAIDFLLRAVTIDPDFAQGWNQLAGAYGLGIRFFPEQAGDWQAKRTEARAHAVSLAAPDSSLGTFLTFNSAAGAGNLVLAADLLENYSTENQDLKSLLAGFYARTGRLRDAISILEEIRAIDPLWPSNLPWIYFANGQFDEAMAEADRQRPLGGPSDAYWAMGLLAAFGKGDVSEIDKRLANFPEGAGPIVQMTLAMMQLRHDPDTAMEELRSLYERAGSGRARDYISSMSVWAGYFDEPDLALDMVEQGVLADYSPWAWSSLLSDMRKLPGFKDYVREQGLVDYWRAYEWPDFCRPLEGNDDFECF